MSSKIGSGVGIRRIHELNSACFIKLGSVAVSSSSWATWFRDRYLREVFYKSSLSSSLGSCIWREIKSIAPFILQGLKWRIGNGRSVNQWNDRWLADQPLSSLFLTMEWILKLWLIL